MANEPEKLREKREIYTHAYTPVCPVHLVAMIAYKHGKKQVYFHCPKRGDGCRRNDKAPKVPFVPITDAR